MRSLIALFCFAAVAQAIDVDWSTVDTMDVFPEGLAELIEERLRDMDVDMDAAASRVVGGVEATPGQFPYQVALLSTGHSGTGFCGGSILNEEWVLTAAHCVDVAISAEIIVAAHDVTNGDDTQFRVAVSEIIVHSEWDTRQIKNDLALLKLAEPLEWSDLVQPIRLPCRSQVAMTFASETGTVSGWGRPSDSATAISPVLRWTSNNLIRNFRCNRYYLGNIDDSQICMSGMGGRSACNGDSGGPLTIIDTDGEPTQVGVVSFGIGLGCGVGWPGVYVRVTEYLDWIETNTAGSIAVRD